MNLPNVKSRELVAPRLRYLQELEHNQRYFNVDKSWYYKSHSVAHVGKPMLVALGRITKQKVVRLDSERVAADLNDVKDFTRSNDRRLLNISEGTLAAWKAHDTRGTYGNILKGLRR